MSARHYRSPEDTFRAPASYRREASEASPAEADAVPTDDTRTRLLRDVGPETTPLESRVPQVERAPQGQVPGQAGQRRTDETLVAPALRGRAAAGRGVQQAYGGTPRQGQRVLHRAPASPQAGYQAARPQPDVVSRGYDSYARGGYDQPVPRRHRPGRAGARGILLVLSWLFRLAAIALAVLVVLDAFTVGNRMTLMQLTARAAELLPSSLAGLYVLDTPFGGAFRGDFAIASVVLFVLDWVCARIRRALA